MRSRRPQATNRNAWRPGADVVIRFGPQRCKMLSPYPKWLDRALAVPYPGYVFIESYKEGRWDGRHHFLTKAGYFPTGLLPLVYCLLKTGINPLKKRSSKPAINELPKRVVMRVPKYAKEHFNPTFLRLYLNRLDLLGDGAEKDHVLIPGSVVRSLRSVRKANPAAGAFLEMLESLSQEQSGKMRSRRTK